MTLVLPRPAAQPVARDKRIAAVDVLRGFALLGILTMNIVAFAWPQQGYENPVYSGGAGGANVASWFVNQVVFNSKMMSLFSMLFGAGLVLMDERARERGASLWGVYYRRTLWLLVFGLAHAYLIWWGDILYFYAACGLVLFFFRRLSPGWLLGLGLVLLAISSLIGLGFVVFAGLAEESALAVASAEAAGEKPTEFQVGMAKAWNEGIREYARPTQESIDKEIEIYRGGYLGILAHRAPFLFFFQIFGLALIMFWAAGGRMLLGMGLAKLGVFSATCSWRFYQWLALVGYGIGLPLTVIGSLDILWKNFEALDAPIGGLLFALGTVPVALGHAAVVMMICKAGVLPWATRPLAAVGQMALTNYLLQSLICTTLFYGYGLGWFARLDRVGLWAVVIGVWALQLVISPLWLARFRYGPAEWLWRSLTYWKLQPMRIVADAASVGVR